MKRYDAVNTNGDPLYAPSPDGEMVFYSDVAQWVSVDDRLPIIRTDGAHVQVSVLATDGDNVCQMNFHSGTSPYDWYEWSEYGGIEPALITHWQPLPLPPSEAG